MVFFFDPFPQLAAKLVTSSSEQTGAELVIQQESRSPGGPIINRFHNIQGRDPNFIQSLPTPMNVPPHPRQLFVRQATIPRKDRVVNTTNNTRPESIGLFSISPPPFG